MVSAPTDPAARARACGDPIWFTGHASQSLGMVLEMALRGRSGVYDVTVRCGEKVVAELRGRSRSLGRPILEEER